MSVAAGARPDDFRVTAILSVFNEADVIEAVVRYLIEQGVQVYVIDDGCTDDSIERLRPFEGRGLIGTERRPPAAASDVDGFHWTEILRRKEELALEIDSDWFIHHDADEFREGPWEGVDLRESIRRVDRLGFNAIDFALLNFRPVDDRFEPGTDVREALNLFERGDAWDSLQMKCWKKRHGQRVDLATQGGHEVLFPGRKVFPLRFLLRHYPIRSSEQGRRKLEVERRPRFRPEERDRGWHVQYDDMRTFRFWEAADLEPFDPLRVRFELLTAHRWHGKLRAELAEVRRTLEASRRALETQVADRCAEHEQDQAAFHQARREAESFRARLADRERELDETVRASGEVAEDRARLRAALEAARGEIERLAGAAGAREAALQDDLETAHARLAALETLIDRILTSRSWRLTAPLRGWASRLRGSSPGADGSGR